MLSFTPDLIFYIVKLFDKKNLNKILNIKYFYNILTSDSINYVNYYCYNNLYIK